MPVANPLVNGLPVGAGYPPAGTPADTIGGGGAATAGAGSRPAMKLLGDKTPMQVATLVMFGLVGLILLQMAGFRFVFDVGMKTR